MRFRILGPLEVSDDDRPLDLGVAKQRSLPTLLLLDTSEVVSTFAPDGTRWRCGGSLTGAGA